MAANLNANVTISGNLIGLSTQIVSTMNVASGFAIGGSYVNGFRTTVAAGDTHTAVLLTNGTVRTFGYNPQGQLGVNDTKNRLAPVQVWGISSSATAVAGGRYHTAVLLADGTVRTFGYNNRGQLGVNDTTQRNTPVQVFGISSSATAVACGYYHTAVLLADGTVRTFGYNNRGQLGVNDTTTRQTPVQVFGISSSATAVACGVYHTAVLLADGTVRTFGFNSSGQLGVNDTTTRQTPVQVFGISSSATAVACGSYHTAVLLADGTVRTFGRNQSGQLGVGDTASRLTPVQVLNISTAFVQPGVSGIQLWTTAGGLARKVAAGSNHTAVLLVDGTVRTFGANSSGQLGVNDTTSRLTPVQVLNITSATAVACAYGNATAILLSDGTVRTIGANANGQLGVNDTTSRLTPVQVWGISSSATSVAFGFKHAFVLITDGTVRSFGNNAEGQLGINDQVSRLTPVQVLGITSATQVACGNYHSAILLANGTVQTLGRNTEGQLGLNDTTRRLTPSSVLNITSATAVACGVYHTVVLLANGTVFTFGRNLFGNLGVNDTTNRSTPVQVWGISSSATAIATGSTDHTTVLLSDGTLRTVGYNGNGQLGVNDTTQRNTPVTVLNITSASSIANGYALTAVLLQDGSVRTFGQNGTGQLGVNDTVSRLTPVSVFGVLGASPYVNATCLSLGLLSPQYQLDMSTDKARKLTTTTWTTGSDQRIKTDVESANLSRCVDIVDSLDLKYFKWNFPPGTKPPTDRNSLGWIAQDVKEFFPKSVRLTQDYGFDDFHNLDSDQLIKTMYGALKKMCEDTYKSP